MKRLVILALLFFAAVAISPLLVNEKGYILIAMGDLTIESTVVTAGMMLVVLFITLIILLKVLRGSLKFSLGTWNKIAFAGRRRGVKDFNRGIAAYILDDYAQAEHLFAKSAEPAQCERTAYLLAAAAASKQSLRSNTNHYLTILENYDNAVQVSGLESVLVTIKLLIAQKDVKKARTLIDEHHKHIGHDARLLSLEIDLCIIEQRYDTAVDYLVSARKQKSLLNTTIKEWEAVVFSAVFNEKITKQDNTALSAYWKSLPRKIKQREAIILAYCQILAKHNITEPLDKILVPAIKKGQDTDFIKSIRTLPLSSADTLISIVQKHLHHDQLSALWLSYLAHLARASKQWPMAEKAFNSLVHLDGQQYDDIDLNAFADTLEQQGEFQKANQVLRKITN
ncbi:MAG: heme biosynthesis protein HemY [Colwellia sp.]|nr:heme biosynthesis protein HemY [Colwellia sp.]